MPINLALGKTTEQSSEGWSGAPARAVDGNEDGDYFGSPPSCTHTNAADPWWKVDLVGTYEVTSVVVWNRVGCCSKFTRSYQITYVTTV